MFPKLNDLHTLLLDPKAPLPHRKQLLAQVCMEDSDTSNKIIENILAAATSGSSESLYKKKMKEVDAILEQLEQGPLRPGTFLGLLEAPSAIRRATVVLEDGSTVTLPVPDEKLAKKLERGDTVLLDQQGKALLLQQPPMPFVGEKARFERLLPDGQVEVTLREHDSLVFRASQALSDRLISGEVEPGADLIVCSRRMMAFGTVPPRDGLSHYRFLSREPVPDVVAERDIGDPPPFIATTAQWVRMEMTDPEHSRRWGNRPFSAQLLTGVTGSGKSLSLQALWHDVYEVMSDLTGVAVDALPPRVMYLRPADVLSKWVGESDKAVDRFFSEAEQLAAEPFIAPDGREWRLPVLIIAEEADGLGRARGSEPVYDRILSTILQRLDTTRKQLADKFILFVATTNLDRQCDPAFLRRIGGTVETFGRLGRRGTIAVLDKLLARHPVAAAPGQSAADVRRSLVSDVVGWLYGPSRDEAQIEITYAGATRPEPRYRRELLTGSVIDRAVQHAAREGSLAQWRGENLTGLTTERVIAALDAQLADVAGRLDASNAHEYLDVPENLRVQSVRHIDPPSIQPFELEIVA